MDKEQVKDFFGEDIFPLDISKLISEFITICHSCEKFCVDFDTIYEERDEKPEFIVCEDCEDDYCRTCEKCEKVYHEDHTDFTSCCGCDGMYCEACEDDMNYCILASDDLYYECCINDIMVRNN